VALERCYRSRRGATLASRAAVSAGVARARGCRRKDDRLSARADAAEYDYESAPSAFAFLRLPDDSLREKIVYPELSPTPLGVHRAYCNDDDGGPRSVCQDGAGSRLILAVNNGYLAAYAREVPSLLETLTVAHPLEPKVAELVSLFIEPSSAEEVAVSAGGSCAFAMDFSLLGLSPDETGRERVIDAINDNTALCGMHASGSVLNPSRRLVLLAKDEAAAKAIAVALKRRALESRHEAVAAPAGREEQIEFDKARHAAAVRAGRNAKLELNGRRLSATVVTEPNEAELRVMSKLLDARRASAKHAAEVIRELAEGRLPSAEQLEAFAAPAPRNAPVRP
jgi:hypothetical protein